MPKHWSEDVIEDIIGAFKIFAVSSIVIYVALVIAKTLYPSFPFDNNSYGIVAVILGLFFTFVNFVKNKASF
jgi:predicted membrane chloride channel (bestrophin family)